MPPTTAETREAILRNARAAERDRLRNIARTRWPELTDAELDAKVREVDTEKLDRAGQLGRRTQKRNGDIGKLWLTLEEEIQLRAETLLHLIRAITPAATPATDEDKAA